MMGMDALKVSGLITSLTLTQRCGMVSVGLRRESLKSILVHQTMQKTRDSFMGMVVMRNIISPTLLTRPPEYGIIGA